MRIQEKEAVSTGPQPAGAYSRAVRVGDLIFLSGQVPKDFESGAVIGESVEEQTRAVMANLERVLGAAGCSLRNLVSVTAYLADIEAWEEFDRAYRSLIEPPYPARTTLGAELHGVLVEISAIAVAGEPPRSGSRSV